MENLYTRSLNANKVIGNICLIINNHVFISVKKKQKQIFKILSGKQILDFLNSIYHKFSL